jgi:hypothetical protein
MKYGMEVITQGLNQALTVQKGLWAQSFGLYEQSLNLREQNCQQLQSQWQQWQQQAAEQTPQQQKRVHESTEGATEVLWSGLGTQAIEVRKLVEQQWEQAQAQVPILQEQAVAQINQQIVRTFHYERQMLDAVRNQVVEQLDRVQTELEPTQQAAPQPVAPESDDVAPAPKTSPLQATGRAGLQNRKPKNTTK